MYGWTGPVGPDRTSREPVGYHDTTDTDRHHASLTGGTSRTGQHRPPRRSALRPALAAGVAAVVSLAVMVGAGMALTATDSAPPSVAEDAAGDLFATTAAPTDAPPSATPSRTGAPTPTTGRGPTPSHAARRTPTTAASPTRATSRSGDSTTQRVVTLVNQERAKAGCGAVTVNAKLATAARLHSEDQAAHQTMSHDGSDGSDFVERARRAGYLYPIGENVAMGYQTPEAVMRGWMNSPGHRANILNCAARAIGVGVATGGGRLYWTQVFGSRP